MNQTNIEHLFQLTAGAIRAPGPGARQSEQGPVFGDHFNLATTTPPDVTSKPPGRQESIQEPPRTSSPPAPDASQRPSHSTSSDRAGADDGSHDRSAESSGKTHQADETADADRNSDADAAETAARDEKNSSDDKHSSELAEGAEQPIAAAERNATANDLLAKAAEARAAAEDTAGAANVATGENSSEEQGGDEAATTNERNLKLTANGDDLENPLEQRSAVVTQAAEAIETTDSAHARRAGKSAAAESAALAAATNGKGQPDAAQSDAQRAATSNLSPEAEATLRAEVAGKTGGEAASDSSKDDVRLNSDEPRRAAAGGPSRSQATPHNVAAAVANVAAAKAGDATANAAAADDATGYTIKSSAPKADALSSMLGRPNAGSSAANRAGRAAGDDELPRVDPARFIGRVTKAFQTAQDRGGTLQLRLSPPELGSLRLELTVKEGVLTATMETETTAARRLLLDHLPALRDRLAEQNIRVERFDVDVRRDGSGGQADGRAAQQQNDHQPDQPPPRRQGETQTKIGEPAPRETPALDNRNQNAKLNLVA